MDEQFEKQQLKKFIVWSVLLLVFFLIVFIYIGSKINHLSLEIQDKKSQIQATRNRENNINQLQSKYYQIVNDISIVDQTLPDEENVASFVKYLENLAQNTSTGVEILFDNKANIEVSKNKYLVFSLNISGPGNNVSDFWGRLERGSYFINVSNFNFNSIDGLETDTKLNLKAKVFTNDPYTPNK